jgi:hypothetical protein
LAERPNYRSYKISWTSPLLQQNWSTFFGLQFENLVLHNRLALYDQLGLTPHDIECDGPYAQRQTSATPGCQIDYLIQGRFNTLYVCKVKFSQNPVGASVIHDIKQKIQSLKIPKYMSVRPVLIHANKITHDVASSPYFYKIIDFSHLV